MQNVITKAKELKESAIYTIDNIGLDKILNANADDVFYTGSFYLDLMVWPDIDICIVIDNEIRRKEIFMTIINEIGLIDDVYKMNYRNYLSHNTDSLPNGLYTGVFLESNNRNWKIDIWAFNREDYNNSKKEMTELSNKISIQDKELILRVKNRIMTKEGRTPPFSGYHIYKAVIEMNMKSDEKIIEYLKKQKIL